VRIGLMYDNDQRVQATSRQILTSVYNLFSLLIHLRKLKRCLLTANAKPNKLLLEILERVEGNKGKQRE